METVCIKIGGSTLDSPHIIQELTSSIAQINSRFFPVIVHGGGL